MGREATHRESKSQLLFAFIWFITTAALLAAFQTIGIPQALGDDSPGLVDTAVSDFPLTGPDLSQEELPTILYGGLLWSVVEVRTTPTEEMLGRSVIDVDIELTNTLSTTELRVSDREVSLVTQDGQVLPDGRFVDAGTRLTVGPGESTSVTYRVLTGHSRNPDPRDLSLVIGESNRIPAAIPLEGDQPENVVPLFVAVDSTPALLEDPDDAQRQIVVEPLAATLGINAGPYRAALGERLALVKVQVQRSTDSETSRFLDTDFWSMTADDVLVAPIVVTRTSQPATNADEITLLFAFPEEVLALALEAGVGGNRSATFALVIPGGS